MKKLFLSILAFLGLSACSSYAVIYQAPNAGNMNFYTLMQHQVEEQETLDFIKDPEGYKEKRARKDAQLDYIEGKTNTSPYFNLRSIQNKNRPRYNTNLPTNMEFSKDSNGQVIIRGIK